ncbi:cupin domain-containing protein [Phenylobacterium montanum]|uniref:Cupin domain-containing protein n=1 Tax=Phenylobacterium montanum TaxID=2823693 RepID=A0A975IVA7_9CAUL|nr:cupin domain-containing protein [Caulobacter sp. S6]QUD88802.1 cupin domain-containing protein [Caulobacter sp. S6]
MEFEVGERLRYVRERAGLSQRVLAKKAGITNSTVSLIESGRTNPSVGALKRILDAVPIGLADFFALEPDRDRQVFYRAGDLVEIGKGSISYRQVGRNLSGRALQMLVECYEPGADTGRIPLTHEGEEGGVVIAGRIEVTVDDQRRVLGPGEAYYFDSRRPHRFRCVSEEPCRIISACTPPSF